MIIEHEFGHVIGLADAYSGARAGTNSIVDNAAPVSTSIPTMTQVINPADVGQSNRNLTVEGTCTILYQSGLDTTSCPSDNRCSGYDNNG